MEATVKAWMSGDPVSIDPDASALEALDLMVDRGIRHLPVVDAGARVVGVLSIDDLRAALPVAVSPRSALAPSERELARDWRVGEIMTHAPETLSSDASLSDAVELMADRRIGCLPVVDESSKLCGLISETDALRALATSLWSDQLRERRRSQAELDELVAALRREREALTIRLDRYHAAERDLSADLHDQPMDAPEHGADLRELNVTEMLDALAASRLEGIDRALDHAAQGRLGVCDRCGGRIPVTRLRALPGNTICVACARAG